MQMGTDNSLFKTFMKNPMQFLLNRKINLPEQYANNPQEAVRYLMNSGQMSQETFENLKAKAAKMGINL